MMTSCCQCGWEKPDEEEDESICPDCNGNGVVPVLRNERGEVDFLKGQPTGEGMDCETCDGTGQI